VGWTGVPVAEQFRINEWFSRCYGVLRQNEVTRLLQAWSGGDESALESLTPLIYAELRRLARHYMNRERPGHTLQPTALVNEVYLRLVDSPGIEWQSRSHFFGICARLMRRILIDSARSRHYQKRAGNAVHISLEEATVTGSEPAEELIALDAALSEFATVDERASRVVELRFFGGLSVDEAANFLGVSQETVFRDWRLAKTWLLRRLSEDGPRAL
jgi:RNA polymerase sigma-70 factor, ECF subfamily